MVVHLDTHHNMDAHSQDLDADLPPLEDVDEGSRMEEVD